MRARMLALFLALLLLCACSAPAAQADAQSDTSPEAAAAFVRSEISRIVSEQDPLCIWTEATQLGQPVVLYDGYDVCNGYVYKLYTNDTQTGYMQVNCFDDDEFSMFCYSFAGIPAYEGLSTTAETDDWTTDKLYFFGNMTYCRKLENGSFQPIDGIAEISLEEIEEYYLAYLEGRAQRIAEVNSLSDEPATVHEQNVRTAQDFTLVTTDDFSNLYATRPNGTRQKVTQHCSPTAATNIMLYFRATGDSSLSSSLSNSTIFMELYYAMDTNKISTSNTVQATGTLRSNIQSGISAFCSSRSCTPSSIGKVSSATFTNVKSHLNSGELLLVSLDNYPSEGDYHSVVFFDYSGSNVSFSNGWDTVYHSCAYSSFEVGQFVYVGY